MKLIGLTWFIFTDAEYKRLLKKITVILYQSFTVLFAILVFLLGHSALSKDSKNSKNLFDDQNKLNLIAHAGYGGLAYISSSILDSVYASKQPKLRVFSEISTLASFYTLGSMTVLIFGEAGGAIFGLILVFILAGLVFVADTMESARELPHRRINDLYTRLAGESDRNALITATFLEIILKPDSPGTELCSSISARWFPSIHHPILFPELKNHATVTGRHFLYRTPFSAQEFLY